MGALSGIAKKIKEEWQKHKIIDALKKSNIGLISGLYYICVHRTKESVDLFDKVLQEFNKANESPFFCSNGKYLSLVCYKKNKDFVKRYLSKFVKYETDNVSGISVDSPEEVYKDWIVGFDSYLLSFFREYGVGLNDYFPSGNQVVFILQEKKAYEMVNILKDIIG